MHHLLVMHFTIDELCVHIGSQMIDPPIHHKGGPIFCLVSDAALLIFDRASKHRTKQRKN